jgi:RNA-directed DNA polymerase
VKNPWFFQRTTENAAGQSAGVRGTINVEGAMGLFEDICSYDNLLSAFDRVEENAGTCGIDNVTIEEFSCGLQQRLINLRKSLLDGTYNPDALKKVGRFRT